MNAECMIREYQPGDMDQVLDIWLSASIKAHHFVEPAFWESRVDDMRHVYIPASDTFVCEYQGRVAGFYSLFEDTLAAIFVAPTEQGKGIGSTLLADAKTRRKRLQLTVYTENRPSVAFYEKHGFITENEQVDDQTGQPELLMVYRV